MPKTTMGAVSVRREIGARIAAAAEARGVSMADIVVAACAPVLVGAHPATLAEIVARARLGGQAAERRRASARASADLLGGQAAERRRASARASADLRGVAIAQGASARGASRP